MFLLFCSYGGCPESLQATFDNRLAAHVGKDLGERLLQALLFSNKETGTRIRVPSTVG